MSSERLPKTANLNQNVPPGIDCDPGVCGGDPCIRGTRIPVWALVQLSRLGTSEADILKCYPTLRLKTLRMRGLTNNRIERKSTGKSRRTKRLEGVLDEVSRPSP